MDLEFLGQKDMRPFSCLSVQSPIGDIMKSTTTARVQKHRANLRHKGLKPVQIWVPDVHNKGFTQECERQALLIKNSESDQEMNNFIEGAADLRGWE